MYLKTNQTELAMQYLNFDGLYHFMRKFFACLFMCCVRDYMPKVTPKMGVFPPSSEKRCHNSIMLREVAINNYNTLLW